MTNKIALITGATSGFGDAIARLLANENYDVIVTGRRNDRLQKLTNEIKKAGIARVLPLCFDIREQKVVESAINDLPADWKNIDVLINNAGLAAGLDFLQEGSVDDWERMIDTNVKGLLYITRLVAPIMVKRKTGTIINVGSIAGKEVYPKGNVYCGTKHAVDAITRGLRIDLNPYGIKVGSICPGAAETEFSLVRLNDQAKADKVYEGFTPLVAEDIAQTVLFMMTRPAHVNIADVLILPTAQASASVFNRQ